MSDWEVREEVAERPQATSCSMLALMGLASVFIAVLVVGVAGSILFPGAFGPQPQTELPHPAIGRTPAAVKLDPLTGTGKPVTLDALSGKVVLLNLWATWCGPCWLEAPHIARLGKKYGDRPDFVLLSVSCGQTMPEDVDLLRRETDRFLEKLDLDMPTYVDTDWTTRQALFELGGAAALPSTYVLDRQGVIRGVWTGFDDRVPEEIEQLVLALLREADGQGEPQPAR